MSSQSRQSPCRDGLLQWLPVAGEGQGAPSLSVSLLLPLLPSTFLPVYLCQLLLLSPERVHRHPRGWACHVGLDVLHYPIIPAIRCNLCLCCFQPVFVGRREALERPHKTKLVLKLLQRKKILDAPTIVRMTEEGELCAEAGQIVLFASITSTDRLKHTGSKPYILTVDRVPPPASQMQQTVGCGVKRYACWSDVFTRGSFAYS